ncbi:hypothetical protein ACFYXQ_32685 [Nocardia jiangxiensis]|uniref:Uncharacterized protein n=1 Tax=Nocardia jiangxiensis TaxID=282685 RepID=A0ABW6S8C4_9NOCA
MDFQIGFANSTDDQAFTQQANVFLEIARWQVTLQDGSATRPQPAIGFNHAPPT